MLQNCVLRLLVLTLAQTAFLSESALAVDEGPEIRAARVCAGLREQGVDGNGTFQIDSFKFNGNANGKYTFKQNGVDMGNIEKPKNYEQYISCMQVIIGLIIPKEMPRPLPTHATQRFKACMGNGGGPSCAGGADAYYTCGEYSAIGGGGPETEKALAKRFCEYNENGTPTLAPYKFIHNFSVGGGQCGWTGFTVICNP